MAFRCDKNNTRMRKTARKTTSNVVSQKTIECSITPSPNDSRTTSMHSQQPPWTMRNPNHYLGPMKNFKSILNNTITTPHGISSLLQNFIRQCVDGIGTRLMDTLPRQIHITFKPNRNDLRMIRARSTPMHLQRHPKPEATKSKKRSTSSMRQQLCANPTSQDQSA